MRTWLVGGAVVAFILSELTTLIIAAAVWGGLGLLGMLVLGPLGAVVVTLGTGLSGPVFWLITAAVLYGAAQVGTHAAE